MAQTQAEAIIDQEATDEVEQLMDAEDDIRAYTGQSDYDSLYAAIARKSMRRAEMLDGNLSIARAIKKVMIGIQRYAAFHNCTPNDLEVSTKMSFEGRIVVSISRV